MKEFDLFIPLYYNDGTAVEAQKLQQLQERLLEQFAGLTYFSSAKRRFLENGRGDLSR